MKVLTSVSQITIIFILFHFFSVVQLLLTTGTRIAGTHILLSHFLGKWDPNVNFVNPCHKHKHLRDIATKGGIMGTVMKIQKI